MQSQRHCCSLGRTGLSTPSHPEPLAGQGWRNVPAVSTAACPAHGRTLSLGKGPPWEGAARGPCRQGGAEPAAGSRGARQVLA